MAATDAAMPAMDEQYGRAMRRVTQVWVWTVPALFLVLVLLGLTMRANQARIIDAGAGYFYAIMTLHGLGMAGTAFVAGFAGAAYLLSRHVRINLAVQYAMYGLTVLGVVGLLIACLLGKFGAGWYLLYPLPFISNGVWADWATGLAIVSLIVLGVGWLLGQLELFRAIVARYGLTNSLGWQYFGKASADRVEIPPVVLITMTAALIPGILTTIVAAVLLVLYLVKWLNPSLTFDPLLLKNMVFLWGHTLVNITLYLGVAMVYDLLPKYSGRPWKTTTVVAIAWNAVLIFVLFAFLHHLYMDFAQPTSLQYLGQVVSYLSAVPATAVTAFGVIGQLYRSGMQWRFVPLALFLGVIGWIIGGFAAVLDSTIAVNFTFHNTLWVPAHFHTYFLAGFFLMLWGFLYDFSGSMRETLAKTGLWIMVAGAYGFFLMFYWGGMLGVPRRFADYASVPIASLEAAGERAALLASAAIVVVIVGLLCVLATIYTGRGTWSLSTKAAE